MTKTDLTYQATCAKSDVGTQFGLFKLALFPELAVNLCYLCREAEDFKTSKNLVFDLKAAKELAIYKQRYKGRKHAELIVIPSPFESRDQNGNMMAHATIALVDDMAKTVILQDPYYVFNPAKGESKKMAFRPEVREIYEDLYKGYKVLDAGIPQQEKIEGQPSKELACMAIAAFNMAHFASEGFSLDNPVLHREEMIKRWPAFMSAREKGEQIMQAEDAAEGLLRGGKRTNPAPGKSKWTEDI